MAANSEAGLGREVARTYPISRFPLSKFEGTGDYPNFLTVYFASKACAWIRHRGPGQLEVKISGELDWILLEGDKPLCELFQGRPIWFYIGGGQLLVQYCNGPLQGVFRENRLARAKSASNVATVGAHVFSPSQWTEPALVLAHGAPDLMMTRREMARVYILPEASTPNSAPYYFVLGPEACRILYEGDTLELGGHAYYGAFTLEVRGRQLHVTVPFSSFAQFSPLAAGREELRLERLQVQIGEIVTIRNLEVIQHIFSIQAALQKCFPPSILAIFERFGLQKALASYRKRRPEDGSPEEISTLAI